MLVVYNITMVIDEFYRMLIGKGCSYSISDYIKWKKKTR